MEFTVTWASDWSMKEDKMTFNTLEELKEYALRVGHALVISFVEKTIVVYDDYIE